jgi:uncharacterized membrane protein
MTTHVNQAGNVVPRRMGGSHSRRVIFIDLARALAIVFMLYGHTIDAILAPEYRSGAVFDIWQFQRGLTSSLFLLLSGFAFSIATARHWQSHLTVSKALWKRVRRFLLFIALGYALRLPMAPITRMLSAPDDAWRTWLGVDILQLVGVTLATTQLLVLLARTRRRFSIVSLGLAILLTMTAPFFWSRAWPMLPATLAAYITVQTGSQFPLVPWSAFMFAGAALGQLYAHWGAERHNRYANVVLLLPGVTTLLLGLLLSQQQTLLFGDGQYGYVPGNIFVRAGVSLIILGLIAHASRHVTHLPHVFGAVAQESLLIYVAHLMIVYGSIFGPGLYSIYGQTRTPLQILPIVVLLIASMTLAAYGWNWLKHAHLRTARWVSAAAAVALLARILL